MNYNIYGSDIYGNTFSKKMSLLYDEQDPWKGWTVQDVYQMSEKQLRDFCRETMIMPSSEIPSHELRVAVWKVRTNYFE